MINNKCRLQIHSKLVMEVCVRWVIKIIVAKMGVFVTVLVEINSVVIIVVVKPFTCRRRRSVMKY